MTDDARVDDGGSLRERIARIVNPSSFKSWESLFDYCQAQGDDESVARRYADDAHREDCVKALAKADAILALSPLLVVPDARVDDWALVPRKPTEAMVRAWPFKHLCGDAWSIMLAAAPPLDSFALTPPPSVPDAMVLRVPPGWKLVPIEPTDLMTWEGQKVRYPNSNSITVIYQAMLTAAPSAPAPRGEERPDAGASGFGVWEADLMRTINDMGRDGLERWADRIQDILEADDAN